MRTYGYRVIDVFTDVAFSGNPLAVFLDARELSGVEMQSIASELNLSETVFVTAPTVEGALAKLRIFTPRAEIPFAGHPTIGTVFALVTAGRVATRVTSFALEEGIGLVDVRIERRTPFMAWLRTPPISFGRVFERGACVRALGLEESDLLGELPVQVASAGNPFLYVALRDTAAVDRAVLDVAAMRRAVADPAADEIFLFTPTEDGVYSRMFAPALGVPEDPATGSATGPLGAYLVRYDVLPARDGQTFTNVQGVAMGRPSTIRGVVRMRDGDVETVEIGGTAVTVIDGAVSLQETPVTAV